MTDDLVFCFYGRHHVSKDVLVKHSGAKARCKACDDKITKNADPKGAKKRAAKIRGTTKNYLAGKFKPT